MPATIRLPSAGVSLLITADEAGWCRCTLEDGPLPRYLGAETCATLVEKLTRALTTPTTATFGWVLSLDEAHHALYASWERDTLKLYWQDARTEPPRIVCRLSLSPDDRAAWLATLAQLGPAR